ELFFYIYIHTTGWVDGPYRVVQLPHLCEHVDRITTSARVRSAAILLSARSACVGSMNGSIPRLPGAGRRSTGTSASIRVLHVDERPHEQREPVPSRSSPRHADPTDRWESPGWTAGDHAGRGLMHRGWVRGWAAPPPWPRS